MVKCPECNKNISELDEKCPHCGTVFEEESVKDVLKKMEDEPEKVFEDEKTGETSKTVLLKIINIIQIVGFVITAIMTWISEEEGSLLAGIVYIIIGTIVFAFIKGFSDIIDLLDSINDKLD